MSQPALPFGPPGFQRDGFLVSASNAGALHAVDRWRDWAGPVAALWGEAGSGKSHLAAIWAHDAGAVLLDGPDLDGSAMQALMAAPRFVLDGADQAPDPELLLHLLIGLEAAPQRRALLTGVAAPALWAHAPKDLVSRLTALPAIAIGAPDDALLARVLRRLAAARGLALEPETLAYLGARMERSFPAAAAIVDAIEAQLGPAGRGRRAGVTLARRALEQLTAFDQSSLDLSGGVGEMSGHDR
jgi:chromosomal replication initiation ATPase DnaA